jgi:predicted phosphodiesterase
MKKQLLIFLLSITPFYVQAIKITHGPYLCDMASDGVTVVWKTDLPGPAWVEVKSDTESSAKYSETVAGNVVATETLHRVRINNLQAATKYSYRIYTQEIAFNPANMSVIYGETAASQSPFSFTTFSESGKDVSFLVLNDIHSKANFMKELCASVDFKALDFVCFNGDMWNWVLDENMIFDECMDAAVELFASETPIVFNRGNHETRGPYANFLMDYFPTQDGHVYSRFNIGDICFLVLDCGEDKEDNHPEYFNLAAFDSYREEEARWLEKCVASPEFQNASARIAFLHIPPFITSDEHGSIHLRQTLVPILNQAGIDILFSGHYHYYDYQEANANVKFPTVVNSNDTYLLCTIKDGKIKVEMKGLNSKKTEIIKELRNNE